MKKIDSIVVGTVFGIVAPILGLFIYYLFTFRSQTSFSGFIEYFTSVHLLIAYLSLACYITNLPLFFLFIHKEKYKAARGVLFATIAYTMWVLYEKLV